MSVRITINGVSKKFGSQWILRKINASFSSGESYAVTGPNGSGKSTLLKIISGALSPDAGTVQYHLSAVALPVDEWANHLAFCAPYQELPEEFTVNELLLFHSQVRGLEVGRLQLLDELQLNAGKEIRTLSSGMKQRLKVALAFHTPAQVLLLDEPTSYMDVTWQNWFTQLFHAKCTHRLIVMCSNEPREVSLCQHIVDLEQIQVSENLQK